MRHLVTAFLAAFCAKKRPAVVSIVYLFFTAIDSKVLLLKDDRQGSVKRTDLNRSIDSEILMARGEDEDCRWEQGKIADSGRLRGENNPRAIS